MLRIKFIAVAFCLTLLSCNKTVVNKEAVFNNLKPKSKEYRDKLAEKLKAEPEGLIFVFGKYIDDTRIEIGLCGKDFIAICSVKVNNGIEGIKEAKGGSYSYADLDGLQLTIQDNPEGAVFIYQSIDSVID